MKALIRDRAFRLLSSYVCCAVPSSTALNAICAADFRLIFERQSEHGSVSSIDVSKDGAQLVVCSSEAKIDLLDAHRLRKVKSLRMRARQACFGPDASQVIVTSFIGNFPLPDEEAIKIIRADTEEVVLRIDAFPVVSIDSTRNLLVADAYPALLSLSGKSDSALLTINWTNDTIIPTRDRFAPARRVPVLALSQSGC
jgi:hypothetical protein